MPDKRLTACAECVKGDFVCDVGTDHAYLVAELLASGKCRRAIAADINEKPLAAAENTLKKSGTSEKAQLILSDGLKGIDLDGVTDIVIAGMGGELIASILSCGKPLGGINLVLQPMTHAEFLRRWLCGNGFFIEKETAVIDGTHFYTVMTVQYDGKKRDCSAVFARTGALDAMDESAQKYIRRLAERLFKAANSQKSGGYLSEAAEKLSVAHKILLKTGDRLMFTVGDLMAEMDKIAPLKNIHKGDNSGLIVGKMTDSAKKVLVALDITCDVVREAVSKGAEAIISHHPVIFNPLYSLSDSNPACLALKNGIACICFHSPLDMADGGINDIIYDMLRDSFSLGKPDAVLEPIHPDGRGYGAVCSVGRDISPAEMAAELKTAFGCTVVRYTNGQRKIKRLAFCSGGGGSVLPLALAADADAFITGDIKHDQLITALNNGVSLFDCGHYHTEVIAVNYLISRFKADFPDLDISAAESGTDPAEYAI